MKSYNPSFHDRASQADEAKKKALEQLRAKPPVDEKVLAERQAARLIKEAAERERRAARQAAEREAKAAKAADAADAEKAGEAAVQPAPTDAERKAARDARYAARKSRR